MTTIFEKIVAGQAPCHWVAETEHALAFLDISPLTVGHTLVVPKVHYADLLDIPSDTLAAVMALAQQVAKRQMQVLAADGITVWQNNRAAGGQEVFHYHVHVMPRWTDQRLNRQLRMSAVQLAALAQRLQFDALLLA
jgi:histidine triad (HIT) family protein